MASARRIDVHLHIIPKFYQEAAGPAALPRARQRPRAERQRVERRSNGSRKARARSSGRGCHAGRSSIVCLSTPAAPALALKSSPQEPAGAARQTWAARTPGSAASMNVKTTGHGAPNVQLMPISESA